MKQFFNLFFAILFLVVLVGCTGSSKVKKLKPLAVVSTYALYDVAKAIGAEDIEVIMLIEAGKEIHSYEPTPKQIAYLQEADLFFYSGAGLEPWAKKLDTANKGVALSSYVKLLPFHAHHNNKKFAHDPHYWLDFSNMQIVADVIAKRFSKLLVAKSKEFTHRANIYKESLHKLDEAFKKGLRGCQKSVIVVNHNAYSYLATRYGFKVDALTGLSADAQPSPKVVQQILKKIKQEGMGVVFFEHFENNTVLKSLADDAGVKLETLEPLANVTAKEAAQGVSYADLMFQNLTKLREALECNEL